MAYAYLLTSRNEASSGHVWLFLYERTPNHFPNFFFFFSNNQAGANASPRTPLDPISAALFVAVIGRRNPIPVPSSPDASRARGRRGRAATRYGFLRRVSREHRGGALEIWAGKRRFRRRTRPPRCLSVRRNHLQTVQQQQQPLQVGSHRPRRYRSPGQLTCTDLQDAYSSGCVPFLLLLYDRQRIDRLRGVFIRFLVFDILNRSAAVHYCARGNRTAWKCALRNIEFRTSTQNTRSFLQNGDERLWACISLRCAFTVFTWAGRVARFW